MVVCSSFLNGWQDRRVSNWSVLGISVALIENENLLFLCTMYNCRSIHGHKISLLRFFPTVRQHSQNYNMVTWTNSRETLARFVDLHSSLISRQSIHKLASYSWNTHRCLSDKGKTHSCIKILGKHWKTEEGDDFLEMITVTGWIFFKEKITSLLTKTNPSRSYTD